MRYVLTLWLALWVGFVPAQAADRQVSLVFAGDTTLDASVGKLIQRGLDPFSAFGKIFSQADIRLANLECVIATRGRAADKNYTFRAHPRVLPVIKRHLDGVTLANNHSGDYGREAFAQMLTLLKRAGLAQAGGGMNLAQAHTPWITERNGFRIAILSYNEYMPRSFEADHDAPGIAWSEDEQVVEDIRNARQLHKADLVIPFMHWGWENEPVANDRQRQLAHTMIDAGADAVIGGHPHVTQDIEQYRGKPIVYSVGNFIMKESEGDAQHRAWVLRMDFDAQGAKSLRTHAVRLGNNGVPSLNQRAKTPCWNRGAVSADHAVSQQCQP